MLSLRREITFRAQDFDPIFESKGIDPSSITAYEWQKFSDGFIMGTEWLEVAELACDIITMMREENRG